MPYANPAVRKTYLRIFQRNVVVRRKQEFFKDKECTLCSSKEDLQLHNPDPTVHLNHRVWTYTEVKRVEMLAKFQVLCRACREFVLRTSRQQHGTITRYWMGCRCTPCVNAHYDHLVEERKKYRNGEVAESG